MRKRLPIFLCLLLIYGFHQTLFAQCSEIAFTIDNYEPCRYRVQYNNSNDACYTEIRLQLEQGAFANWTVNTAAGFQLDVVSPSDLWITHTSGVIPFGSFVPIIFDLPPGLTTPMYVAYINACPPGTGCELFPAPVLESCPDPQDASISGVKYVECGNLSYNNQPTVPNWPVELLDADGNVVSEVLTDAGGVYAFYDLPAGQYIVREASKPGWTARVPASGQYAISLSASQQELRNFGNCYTYGSISGITYETCVNEPYVNQPLLGEVPMELLDAAGVTIGETLTDDSGTYSFADLAPGNYYVKKKTKDHWSVKYPLEAFAAVVLNEQENEVVHFGICKEVCPCNPGALETDAAKGFAVVRSGTSCKTCFSPLALKHCDEVEWSIDGGPVVGVSEGSKSFCYVFPAAGSYTLTMTVIRRNSNGTICSESSYARSVTVNCGAGDPCVNSIFGNPGFSEGAVAGGINTDGASAGWYGPCGEPVVVEGEAGSIDGWTMELTGYLDYADVLATQEPVCVSKGVGTIALEFGIKEQGIKSTLHIELYQGPDFVMNDCDGISCFELASIDLSAMDTGWLELELPYDLSGWAALDTCPDGGLLVRPAIFVTTGESSLLPGAHPTRVSVDNVCMPQSTCEVAFIQCPIEATLVDCIDDGSITLPAYPISIGHTGDCLNTQVVQLTGPVSGTTVPLGTYLMTFQAEGYDASAQLVSTDLCTFSLHLIPDIQPPVFTFCPPDITLQGTYDTNGFCSAPGNWQVAMAEDIAPCGPGILPLHCNQTLGAPVPEGSSQITYTASDYSGNTSTCSFVVTVTCTSGTGELSDIAYVVNIHPNPTSDNFTIELPQPATSGMQLRIAGIAGNTLLTLNLPPGTTTETVLSGDLPGGIYFVQILSDARIMAVQKLVKL